VAGCPSLRYRPDSRGRRSITGLNDPAGVAVDTVGNVYVTDFRNRRVLKLAAR
jgi:serine/threonine-protein kinase